MPKIVVHFKAPDSVSLEFKMDDALQEQGLSYLSILATLIEQGKCTKLEALKDSCVILEVKTAEGSEVEAHYGNLTDPRLQLELLKNFLRVRVFMGWAGIPQLIGGLNQLHQMIMNLGRAIQPGERAKQTLVFPGMEGFNIKNLRSN